MILLYDNVVRIIIEYTLKLKNLKSIDLKNEGIQLEFFYPLNSIVPKLINFQKNLFQINFEH